MFWITKKQTWDGLKTYSSVLWEKYIFCIVIVSASVFEMFQWMRRPLT
jgi:hypothetical protein